MRGLGGEETGARIIAQCLSTRNKERILNLQ